MLKSIIENEDVTQFLTLSQTARLVSIRANHDGHASHTPRNQKRFVAGFLPRADRTIAAADDSQTRRRSLVAARQHDRFPTLVEQARSKRDHQGRLAGSAQRQISYADDGMVQPSGL